MPRVTENLQLIAMKSVAAIREHMRYRQDTSDREQRHGVASEAAVLPNDICFPEPMRNVR
jgi:hypothetical protein